MFNFKKQEKEPKDLKGVLVQLKELKENFKKISDELENLKKQQKCAIQKFGIIRFNPFREVGGDQSFSIALLDDNDTGAVLTSYYSRKESKVYGKPIRRGQSEYPLSEEEQEAIRMAKNGNKNGKKLNDN
ncbi:MAG: DUF4446 family protein [Parcubacteria group bacterium]